MKLEYRADIDGLRAVAVLAVVLNHAGVMYFSGGYIGVDIFFVISGFLITTVITREIQENNFSLYRFYERRIRRILPALVGMIVFTLFAAIFMYDSERFKSLGKSLSATMLFYSNINFWKEAGYFDGPSLLKPLLHTWSLAVEEQFYIIFPLFMIAINFYAVKSVKIILSIITLISLGISIYVVNIDPTSAFYLAHLRAWELLLGGLLALNVFPASFSIGVNTMLGFLGMFMIGFSVFQYTENMVFPGLSAIIPVLGSLFVIYSSMTNQSPVGKVLGIPPLVFIGKISYSLYLWHWPLLVFAKYYLIRPMTSAELNLVLVLILAVSTLSWRFVETPFRIKKFLSTWQVYVLAATSMAIIVAVAGAVESHDGFPKREGSVRMVEYLYLQKENYTDCIYSVENFNLCSVGKESKVPSFIFWGDSHAAALRKAVNLTAGDNGYSGVFVYKNACPPLLLNIAYDVIHLATSCGEYNKSMIQYLRVHPEIETVILAGRWSSYIEDFPFKQNGDVVLADQVDGEFRNSGNEAVIKLGLEQMIRTLLDMNRKIVVVSSIPEIGYDVPSANFIATRTGRDLNKIIAPSLDEYFERNQKIFTVFSKLKEQYEFQVVDPWKILCINNICRVTVNGMPLYSDDDHLSFFGSELISPIFEPVFTSVKQ